MRLSQYGSWLSLASKAQAMGLLERPLAPELTPRVLHSVLDSIQRRGLLRAHRTLLERLLDAPETEAASAVESAALDAAIDVLETSPTPETEWPAVSAILGESALASLVGVSASSLKRYAKAERVATDEVADRVHFLAMVIADLAGSYNDLGIRRWFDRPRAQLSGKSPRQALGPRWRSTTLAAQRVRELARSLVGGGAT